MVGALVILSIIGETVRGLGEQWLVDTIKKLADEPKTQADLTSLVSKFSAHPIPWTVAAGTAILILIALVSAAQVAWAVEHGKLILDKKEGSSTVSESPIERADVPLPNLVVTCGRIKPVGLDNKLRWIGIDVLHGALAAAFIAEFTNQPHSDYHVGKADRVRARVRLEVPGTTGRSTTADPAPWLHAKAPDVVFAPGDTLELILGILVEAFDDVKHPKSLIHGIRDQRHLDTQPTYERLPGLEDKVLATVTLTVDSILKGPFKFGLDPGDAASRVAPACMPIVPNSKNLRPGRLYVVRDWFRSKDTK